MALLLETTDQIESACASFAGGFVNQGTDIVVVVREGEEAKDLITVTTTAQAAPTSPSEAVVAIAEACGVAVKDLRATVYVLVGGVDGNQV